MITRIKENVYWVGVVDWGIRKFHGHELSTHRGTTYNSYLIIDEKIALVDTVWGPFKNQLIENIQEIVDPAKIDIVVANHAEVDHSGGLPAVMQHCPNATLVVSMFGKDSIEGHYHQPWNFKIVQTGDSISLGKNELVFVEAPMLHWPDSMFTYLTGQNILMSNDAFGQHYATAFRFNDQVNQEELYEEAIKYYANILTPFSRLVTAKIDEVLELNLPVDIIAPSHGVIWRDDPIQIVKKYQEWAEQSPKPYAVIIFDSMWNATGRMAEAISEGIAETGVDCKIFNLPVSDRNDIIAEIFQARTVVMGSPTFNGGILPGVAPIVEDLRGLKFRNKLGAAFGPYGWTGESVDVIESKFQECKIPIIESGIKCLWQPRKEDLLACRDFGRKIGEATKGK